MTAPTAEHQTVRDSPVADSGDTPPRNARFGPFRLDLATGELFRCDERLPLRPQSFSVLQALLERPGEVVSREQLVSVVWPDGVFVETELGLNAVVRRLRDVLGDSAHDPKYVETLPRRGYRFIEPIRFESGFSSARDATPEAPPLTPDRSGRTLALIVAGAVLILALVATARHLGTARPPSSKTSRVADGPVDLVVAIEPFVFSGDVEDRGYLATALAQEIVVEVGSLALPNARLLPQWSAGTGPTRHLGFDDRADYRISGTYAWQGGKIRVACTLRRDDDGEVVWGKVFQGDDQELLEFQQTLAQNIASGVATSLLGSGASPAVSERLTSSLDALDEHLKGLYLKESEAIDDLLSARVHFERATQLDAGFAEAWSALAATDLRLAFRDPAAEHWSGARAATDQALDLDGRQAQAHLVDGMLRLYKDWDFTSARKALRRALELAPGSAEAQSAYAAYLAVLGRFDEALPRARLARRLDPARLSVRGDLCWYLLHAGQLAEANSECRRALELAPADHNATLGLAEALRQAGDLRGAFAETATAFGVAELPAKPADEAEAQRLHAMLWQQVFRSASADTSGRSLYLAAIAAALTDRPDEALALLRQDLDRRDPALLHFRSDPRFATLRSDPRFDALVREIGFPGGHPGP